MSETIRVLKFNKKNFQKKIFENFADQNIILIFA